MKRFAVLYAPRYYAHYDTFPLRVFRQFLRECGIEFEFHHTIKQVRSKIFDGAILSGYQAWRIFGYSNPVPSHSLAPHLEHLRDRFGYLVWIDSHDSANIAFRSVLEHVDLYLKKQLWLRKRLYQKPLYGGILFKEFYHRKYGIEEPGTTPETTICHNLLDRIQVGWNLSLIDWQLHGRGRIIRGLRVYFPTPKYIMPFSTKPLKLRPYDLVWRGRDHKDTHSIVAFHRNSVRTEVEKICDKLHLTAITSGQVPFRQFQHEIQDSRIVVSPFGWGEICFRDFECFAAGAILLKPNVGHLQTWPNLYQPYVTYVPFKWDFSDIGDKVEDILSHLSEYEQIAQEGQKQFRRVLSPVFGRQFAEHLQELLCLAGIIE